jgi:hypothetical protein
VTRALTDADDAESDVLLDALITGVYDHRERCAVCSQGGPWCSNLVDAFQILMVFRRTRQLRSLAAYLRARETVNEIRLRNDRV